MKKTRKIVIAIIVMLFIGLAFSRVGFAGPSAAFTARCYMPAMVSSTTIEQVTTQNKDMVVEENKEKDSFISEKNPNIVQKTEEITSEETQEPQIITTVCAK